MPDATPLRLQHIRDEAPDTKTFVFDTPPGLTYRAGQYLTLLHPRWPEGRRSYSISAAPALGEPLSICVKRVDNGEFSRLLVDRARVGDVWQTTGAGGLFTLPDDLAPYRQVFFFAAGSGIVPIRALLLTVLHTQPHLHAVLVYSNRAPASTIYYAELQALAAAFPARFRLELLFSTNADLARARLYKDLLEVIVRQHALAPPAQLLAFTCGPLNYMRMCGYGLRELGVPADNIRRENFNPAPLLAPPRPPDVAEHRVTLQLPTGAVTLPVQYPTTILRAARAHGIHLPYSCEGGVCGQCVMRCRSGHIWHAHNEVLTERDLAAGLVLPCVGYPVGGDVVLA